MSRKILSSPDAPPAIGPYSQGVHTGSFIFLAGQLGHNLSPAESTPSPGRHGVLDIPPAHLGQMLPQPDEEDILGDMLEGRV